jgi:hypothetical protein
MSIHHLASADESTPPRSPVGVDSIAEHRVHEMARKTQAIPDLPKDYPRPGRFGGKELWDAVLCRRIPRSTFVDWEKSGKIPPADKMIGRTKFWLEENVHSTMTADKAVA